ncbi:hypothetical protein UK23_35780 [Lentzea aerocolonigenes]|uniref:Uncharacterized protein n=1 Tax=Lentzea aerocolonigenes TaxID=68170 RepID=A0A0F0GL90_LENAE|nr:hypothetical protein UK23_35780 [Lentzea aerocolonigenes]
MLAVAVFFAVFVTSGDEHCGPPTGTFAALSLLPRLMGVLARGLVLISMADKDIEFECPPPG